MNKIYLSLVAGLISAFFVTTTMAEEKKQIDKTPAGSTILLGVCKMLDDQGPLDVNGFPKDGWKVDYNNCKEVAVELYNSEDPELAQTGETDFSLMKHCARSSLTESPHWQEMNPGWLVVVSECPRQDGSFKPLVVNGVIQKRYPKH